MSIYSKIPDSYFLLFVQLSSWDHIFGPIIEQVWSKYNEIDNKNKEVFTYIARQTLDGQIYRSDPEADMEISFLSVPTFGQNNYDYISIDFLDIILYSTVFTASPNPGNSTKFSLSMVASLSSTDFAVKYYDILEDHLRILAFQVQALLNRRTSQAIPTISTLLPNFISLLNDLESTSYTHSNIVPISISNTLFGQQQLIYDISFICRVITSHLQTMAQTIIIGPNKDILNQWIETLSLFLTPVQRSLVRSASYDYRAGYSIQGIILDLCPPLPLISSLLFTHLYPTTVVNLSILPPQIYQCPFYHQFRCLRDQYQAILIEDLIYDRPNRFYPPPTISLSNYLNSNSTPKIYPPCCYQLLQPFKSLSPLIFSLFKPIASLPVSSIEFFMTQNIRILLYYSQMLFDILQKYYNFVIVDLNSVGSSLTLLPLRNHLIQQLHLTSEQDLFVFVGLTERQHPGIYEMLFGSQDTHGTKIIQMFSDF